MNPLLYRLLKETNGGFSCSLESKRGRFSGGETKFSPKIKDCKTVPHGVSVEVGSRPEPVALTKEAGIISRE
jgi:hypothetical protein